MPTFPVSASGSTGIFFTAEAQAMARALSALESVTLWPQRQALFGGE